MMFVALDKLANQGILKVIVAILEKSIGCSFRNMNLKDYGFFADWKVVPKEPEIAFMKNLYKIGFTITPFDASHSRWKES